MDPSLSLERFAAVSAELDAGVPRDKVLQREGIELEAWTSAQEAWLAKLAAEVSSNRFELTNRYNAAFMERRKALEDGDNRPKRGRRAARGHAPPRPAAKSPPGPPRAAGEDPGADPPGHVAPPAGAASAAAAPPAPIEVPSFLKQQPTATPAAPPAVVAPVRAPDIKVAPAVDPMNITLPPSGVQSPWPFAHDRAGKSPADLPFRKPSPSEVASPGDDPLNATAIGQMSPLRAVMPFQEKPGSHKDATRAKTPVSTAGLPFHAAPAPEPRLTLEQFASLAAEIAQNPGGIAQVRTRYHLTEPAHMAESAAWQRRFSADPALFARYSSLFQSYRDWLARPKR